MHTDHLTGKTDDEIISIINNAGRTAEKWEEARKNLGLQKPISEARKESQRRARFTKGTWFDKPRNFKHKFQGRRNDCQSGGKLKTRNKSNESSVEQTKGIKKSELDRRKAAGECQRCAWPADQKGAHKTINCFRWARKETGMVPFPKAKEYQKLKV